MGRACLSRKYARCPDSTTPRPPTQPCLRLARFPPPLPELWKMRNPEELAGLSLAAIKAYLWIIAVSVTARAEPLIGHDPHMVSLAQGRLLVKQIPNPQTGRLF